MKNKRNIINILCIFWAMTIALFWFAMRVIWSGISKVLYETMGMSEPTEFLLNLPLYISIFLVILFIGSIVELLRKGNKKISTIIIVILLSIFTIVSIVVVVMGAIEYLYFIIPKFILSMSIGLCIIGFAWLLFNPIKNDKLGITLKCIILTIVILIAIFKGYGVTFGFKFTYEPVVYVVEDTYQIVFTTNHSATAWVEIDGETYYDLYAGSMKSKDNVHKIIVPQEKLDESKAYSIHAEKMIYRGPFGGFKGNEISKEYHFYPVDSSDGLVYYTMSDVHHAYSGAIHTANAVENLDFLVILGDSVGMVEYENDVQYSNKLAFEVTKGEIPVVYSRGNHEIKGEYAELLYKYVGSKNEDFYYWFTLSDVFGINLDLGEDHDDGWWEYYGTDHFALYHDEQTLFLKELVNTKPYENYNYTMVTCHIPIQFVNSRKDHENVKAEWTALINQIQPDIALYGHQHDLYPFLEGQETMMSENGKLIYNSQFKGVEGKTYGGYLTDYTFNGFIVGRRGTSQSDDVGAINRSEHIGLAVYADLQNKTQKCQYINSSGEIVDVYNPFVEGPSQKEFILDLK